MTTVFIKGFGLIGSSLGRAIKEEHPADQLIISDPDQRTLDYANQHHLADRTSTDFQGISQADYIILAGPVSAIRNDLYQLATMALKPSVIVTDVGSTKQSIMDAAKPLQQKGITFIGGHPMAGSHLSGVRAGRRNLIEGAYYFQVFTPADEQAAKKIQSLLKGLHAHWMSISAPSHDMIVAQLSHVPHVIAAALVDQTAESLQNEPKALKLAAGGFKTITRIASSDPTMWTAIMLNNQQDILHQLDQYIATLQRIKQSLKDEDRNALFELFKNAKQIRDSLPTKQGPQLVHVIVRIPDRDGAIATVTTKISQAGLNVRNLQIMQIREGIDGILQLSFANQEDADKVRQLLSTDFEILKEL